MKEEITIANLIELYLGLEKVKIEALKGGADDAGHWITELNNKKNKVWDRINKVIKQLTLKEKYGRR